MRDDLSELRFATCRLASGPQVHYAERGESDGEPILFLHGYTDSWFSFSPATWTPSYTSSGSY